jgi:uncharacterized protein YyaL (SSP411 family)
MTGARFPLDMSNQLSAEPSAYLQSAAHQPVHWLPWSEAAFAHAASVDKPILLDIGAVWCHWCHVMDRESYEDPAVADVLNREYVCVKVDRDERPDVDLRYQRAVQALTGQGGWPLTAFLTPGGEVFFGGTYFPPEPNPYGRPGFLTVLVHVARLYREEPAKVAERVVAIQQHVLGTLDETKSGSFGPGLLEQAAAHMARAFDVRYGGFGGAPKFPHPATCQFLTASWHDARTGWMRDVVEKTLDGMARGGVHDQLGGGFHRYSVDERWIVPHFEKMVYDNSELLHAYASAAAAFGTARHRAVASGIVDWVFEILSDPSTGAFYSSQDADVGPEDDGDYWTWTPDEARATLTAAEFEVARRVFDIEARGEMHHHPEKNVLWWSQDPAGEEEWTILKAAIRKLKAARDRRPAPYVDKTPYVAWNAMMASAFLSAGAILDRPPCNTLALKVLERLWAESWDSAGGMSHIIGRAEPRGMLDDNVQSAAAFLDAYEATGREEWLKRAATVMKYCDAAHWDESAGGYFDLPIAPGRPAYLGSPAKPVQDAPTPSANGVAALVLARLWATTDSVEWRSRLDRQLAAFAGVVVDIGLHGATMFRAIDWAVHPPTRIEVSGPTGDGPACAMHLLALQAYRPRKVVVRRTAARPTATVCVGTTCSLPVSTPDALRELLA